MTLLDIPTVESVKLIEVIVTDNALA